MELKCDVSEKLPVKMLSPFLSTAPLQYVPKIQFTQATIDCLINSNSKNAFHNKVVILSYISGDSISHGHGDKILPGKWSNEKTRRKEKVAS